MKNEDRRTDEIISVDIIPPLQLAKWQEKENTFTITYGQANIAIRKHCYYQYKPNEAWGIPTIESERFHFSRDKAI